jgi:2-phosphosulfolactate phosphatase
VQLFVYHTPELTPTEPVPNCAVAVDVLRATTTMTTALSAGAKSVQAFSDIKLLMETSESVPANQRLRAGERGGKQVSDCEMGNSPLDCTPEKVSGRKIFLSTTNGTRALQKIKAAPVAVAAALVNRQVVVDYLVQKQPETLWIVGSGWEGSYSLEDTVCAGAIIDGWLQTTQATLADVAGNDEAIAAHTLYFQWQNQLLRLMELSSHGRRLLGLERHEDLKYCAQLDILDVLPLQTSSVEESNPIFASAANL